MTSDFIMASMARNVPKVRIGHPRTPAVYETPMRANLLNEKCKGGSD
jgi:hypothetical protein